MTLDGLYMPRPAGALGKRVVLLGPWTHPVLAEGDPRLIRRRAQQLKYHRKNRTARNRAQRERRKQQRAAA